MITNVYPEWASYNIGIFVCTRCAGVHRSMGAHISKVKHLKLDRWEDSQVNRIREVGNITARLHYEERVPPCYRKPNPDAPQVLVEQWIRAKYEREEFCHPERQNYVSGFMEGFLMKRGKEDSRYHPRKFVLCEAEDTLKYHVKENKEPKAILRISELNVAFAPSKTGNQNSLQISFMKDGTTRHIYVYHEDPEVITNWYLAIRCAKLHRLQVAYPGATEAELLSQLTRDFPREGFLWKTGPRHSDAYKKRWFTLDGRKLMYHDDPMDAHPKGEIFLGHSSEGFAVKTGVPPGARNQGFSFTLETPDRSYLLSAQNDDDRTQWMNVIQKVIDKPLTPQDATVAARLVRKRTASGTMNIFSSAR
ncbi:arf-GAP with dual PH domain-containing protein 1-like isoform X3 [Vespula pensylvanica]|uniref:arf-GAP with dual PH domain-containing protein 1-like isoform X3 n=1 Tax=Vespula pensylvanica TaxID=30213 RepID=UPI001CBA1425|nr:arf-GAP with dual PH domain-containing protein 1-like isoform X3 [Vespula pensylvanica]XP_050856656.1 arf-GAP with dual PH domain-containing protein 1-like isoform X3 [Vespula vulgaris]